MAENEDRELFDAAISNDPPPAEPEAQAPQPEAEAAAPEPKADATGRLHGEGGKFAPKTPKEPQPEQVQTAPVVDAQPDHRVPLTELLNEREKRQQHERERDQFRQQAEAYQRQLAELQRPKQQDPDIFENPQGFVENLRQEFRQGLRHQELNFSLRQAHREYKQDFEQAYNSALSARQQGDPAVDAIIASTDPGEALMRWHRSRTLLDRTGGDLDKFMQTHTDSLLDNEEFLAKAAEKIRARHSQPNGQRPVINLPPSLNKVPAAQGATDGDNDMSDAALFRHARR